MPECKCCGKNVELPFKCKFCGGYYCLEHRLPENHDCPNQPPRTPLGSFQTKMALAQSTIKTEKIQEPQTIDMETETEKTFTRDNIYGYHFEVPVEVYSDDEYKKKLDETKTLDEVERIIRDYYRKHPKEKTGKFLTEEGEKISKQSVLEKIKNRIQVLKEKEKTILIIALFIGFFCCSVLLFAGSDLLSTYFKGWDFLHFHLMKISSSLHFIFSTGWIIVWVSIIPIPIPLSGHSVLIAIVYFGSLIFLLIGYIRGGKKGLVIAILMLLSIYFIFTEPERISTRDFNTKEELLTFLKNDNTNQMQYTSSFTCIDFSLTLIEHAKASGYRIYFTSTSNHAFCKAYIVSEGRWVNIEPQTDEVW